MIIRYAYERQGLFCVTNESTVNASQLSSMKKLFKSKVHTP
jgi:hypothetical protein